MAKKKVERLENRAMLVDLNIRQWTAAKQDAKISREVTEAHGADPNMGHYYKQLMSREAMQEIRRLCNAAFSEHYTLTLPWMNSGARILSSKGYLNYMAKMREYKEKYDAAVAEFVNNYEDFRAEAEVRLNGMFDEKDYPTTNQVRAKFSYDVIVSPLPVAKDFRVSLGKDDIDRIRADIESTSQEALRRATNDIAIRIQWVAEHMVERLRAYNGTMQGSFRDTLVSNVKDVVDLIPILNVTADPRIEELRARMESELCLHDPQTLRTDEVARETTAKAAEDILERLKEFAL